jgi:hypothetical protein
MQAALNTPFRIFYLYEIARKPVSIFCSPQRKYRFEG